MTTVFGTLSGELVTALAAAFPDAAWYEGGAPDVLPPASTAVGYVWVAGSERVDSDHFLQEVSGVVRYYPVQTEQADAESPVDPSALYQAVDDLQTALKAIQTPGDTSWFFEVSQVAVDHDNQVVTATILATGPNQFALA